MDLKFLNKYEMKGMGRLIAMVDVYNSSYTDIYTQTSLSLMPYLGLHTLFPW